ITSDGPSLSCSMGATVFVQPLDLVKNRMQLSGQGTKAREYKTSFHALFSILKNEGLGGIYTGSVPPEGSRLDLTGPISCLLHQDLFPPCGSYFLFH
uniref:Uncharacterized protein n=1 Tax=Poecilia latipinna TaxID=48699 RepID=A0A3B3V6D7_9TELE